MQDYDAMTTHKARIAKLEARDPAPQVNTTITDEERLRSMKAFSLAIAEQAELLGITAADNPTLALPLTIADILHHDKP